MRKCPDCNSCLQYRWYCGETYKYCSLCKTVYKVKAGGNLERVFDEEIIRAIFRVIGNVI